MAEVVETGQPVHGINGRTPLAKVPGFDFVQGLVPEYMHSCCQGTFKQFLKLWTDSKHSKKPWYIGPRNLKLINQRLSKCCPPYDVTRSRFDIDDIANWKASMFKAFALYFYVVFEGFLEPQYLIHFTKLSYSLFVLLQDKISVEDVLKIEVLLKYFVIETEVLYGIEELGINIHFLTHLAQAVINWGCLWTTSTFIPNGLMVSFCV